MRHHLLVPGRPVDDGPLRPVVPVRSTAPPAEAAAVPSRTAAHHLWDTSH
ncbi:hypothetical protein LUW75_15500 [Streptomyces sp. MRC013]|nr:hypothetical protein [Streptomyces sp. MRC013]URM91151.1 hypothetical protein LUW75_15500 [Streptomyces sp. MRC013]